MNLEEILTCLDENRQRATYGAVSGYLGVAARGLMADVEMCPRASWVVASADGAAGNRAGWPTGYHDAEIHPLCLVQIRNNPNDFISDAEELGRWLDNLN